MSSVYKLGGTSQCKKGYDKLITIIKNEIDTINPMYIVLSAVAGVTNNLVKFTETKDFELISNAITLNKKIIDSLGIDSSFIDYISSDLIKLCKKYTDTESFDIYIKYEIIGYGEIMSTNILHMYFKLNNINNQLLNSYDYIYSKREIDQYNIKKNQTEFYCKENLYINTANTSICNVFILQGFICSTPSRKTITLGRGGSDITGALVAKVSKSKVYEVWTDVDGIYNADPRIFSNSFQIKQIDYELCQELSAMGAKVMHPLSIKPCIDVNIPIVVKNTFSDSNGTIICNEKTDETCYAVKDSQTVFKIKLLDIWNSYTFVSDIFARFNENQIDIDIVSTSQFSMSGTTCTTNFYKLKEMKDKLSDKYKIEIINNCTIFSVVKRNIKDIIGRLNFDVINPEIINISDSGMTLNIVVKEINLNKILQVINK